MGINKKAVFKFWLAFLIVSALFLSPLIRTQTASAAAGINSQLSFEGKIVKSDGTNISDGTYNMEFKIYQDGNNQGVGSTLKWTEDWLVGGSGGISLTSGTFQVNLGAHNPFASQVDWNQDTLWLSMQIGNSSSCTISTTFQSNCSGDGEMKPYIRLTAVPYAQNSASLSGLTAGNFVQMAQGLQTDSSTTNASISINKTNASGSPDILLLQKSGKNVVEVNNSGTVLLGQAGASGLNGTLTFNNSAGTNTVSLSLQANPGSSYTLLLPTTGPNVSQCLQTDAATANQLVFSACSTGGSGATSVAYSTTSNANGGSISGSVLTLAKADGSNPGLLSADAQTIGGNKTFAGGLVIQTPSNPVYVNGMDNVSTPNSNVTAISVNRGLVMTGTTANTANCNVGGNYAGCEFNVLYLGGDPSVITSVAVADSQVTNTGGTTINAIATYGDFTYLAVNSDGSPVTCSGGTHCELEIYNTTTLSSLPAIAGSLDSTNAGTGTDNFKSLFISGHYLYVGKSANTGTCSSTTRDGCELQIYDLTNPTSPTYVGGAESQNAAASGTDVNSVFVSGHYAYLAVNSNGSTSICVSGPNCEVLAYDVSNPSHPTLVDEADSNGSRTGTDNALSVFATSRYVFVGKQGNSTSCTSDRVGCELQVYGNDNFNNNGHPLLTPVGGADNGGTTDNTNAVFASGDYIYVAKAGNSGTCSSSTRTGCELQVYSIATSQSSPTYMGGTDIGGTADSANSLYVSGRYIYVGKTGNSGTCSSSVNTGCEVQVYDATGMVATSLTTGSLTSGGLQVRNDAFIDSNLYVASGLSVNNGILSNGSIGIKFKNNSGSGSALSIAPSFSDSVGGISNNLIEMTDFTSSNTSGIADTLNGIRVGNLTESGGTINSTGILIGTGWDVGIAGAGALSVQSGGANTLSLDAGGAAAVNIASTNATSIVLGGNTSATITQKVANSSTTAFQLQTAGGTKYLVADTTGVGLKVGGGDVSADATPVILVLDHKSAASGSTDPTGTNGGMYYNESLNKLRCFENSAWVNCITAASILYGFAGGAGAATKATTTYYAVGTGTASTTRANQEIKLAAGGTLKNLNVFIVSNATTGQTNTVQVYINGAATGPSITFTTATGWLSDTTNTATVNTGDTLTFALTNGGSGGGTINIVMGSASVIVQ